MSVSNLSLFRSFFERSNSMEQVNAVNRNKRSTIPDDNSFEHILPKKKRKNKIAGEIVDPKNELFWKEKARRDVIFRDKNAANFNITGVKNYEKGFPIRKVQKVYYNDILSYDEFMAEKVNDAIHDKTLSKVKPTCRKLNEVMVTSTGKLRV